MEANKSHNNRKKPDYKLTERNLDIKADMEFIDQLIKDLRLEVAPGIRGLVLDIAYTLARDKLVEAVRFAKLSNRTNVTVEDLKMVHLGETDELKNCVQTLKNADVAQEILPKPCMEKGLMLPNWRNCQVGMMPELQVAQKRPPPKVVPTRPAIIRRLPKGQNLVAMPAMGKTGGPQIKVIPGTSKGPVNIQPAPVKTVPVKVAPVKAVPVKTTPAKPSLEASKPSATSPIPKKLRLN